MKFLRHLVMLLIFLSAQSAQHPAEKLAQRFIALIGEQYGKASSDMSQEVETAIDKLYSENYTIISNDNIVAISRDDYKKKLKNMKETGGLWRVTNVVYFPNSADDKYCNIAFCCWTEKTGVFAVNAEIQSSDDGTRMEFLEETVKQIYTVEQVS